MASPERHGPQRHDKGTAKGIMSLVALVGVLLCLALSAPAAGQNQGAGELDLVTQPAQDGKASSDFPPGPLAPAPSPDEPTPQGLYVAGIMLSPVLWIYLLPMTLLVLLLAAVIAHTGRRKQLLAAAGVDAVGAPVRRLELPLAQPREVAAAMAEASTQAASTSPQPPAPTMELQALFSLQAPTGQKECPKCKRTYETVFELCPYDATALRPLMPVQNDTRQKRKILGRLRCSGCDRRYELGARYCYADGLPLVPDTDEESARAPRITVCQSCGFEGKETDRLCPHDSEPLTVIEPNDNSRVAPTIPLLLCKTCRRYASPGTVHCPHDGELLTPVTNARITALSPTGFGVRRKLCRKCGTRFSGAATFCSHDGTRLTPIN
jgi:hypothetical protein